MQVRNAELQGQLTESHRVEETTRNELEACRLKNVAAEKVKNRAEMEKRHADKKRLEAYNQVDEHKNSLQDRLSDLETAKDKLQACQRYAEELEAERDDYKGKLSDSNELIMQRLHTQVCPIL